MCMCAELHVEQPRPACMHYGSMACICTVRLKDARGRWRVPQPHWRSRRKNKPASVDLKFSTALTKIQRRKLLLQKKRISKMLNLLHVVAGSLGTFLGSDHVKCRRSFLVLDKHAWRAKLGSTSTLVLEPCLIISSCGLVYIHIELNFLLYACNCLEIRNI